MARKSRKMKNAATDNAGAWQDGIQAVTLPVSKEKAIPTAAYIRLSVENNGHESDDSLQTQISLVERYIREHEDLVLREIFVDNGVSGTRFDRPEFVRMMEAVKSGRIGCIVVKDLSRFGRDYLEMGYYIETIFPLLNVRFIAITDNFDSTRAEDRNSISIPIKNMVNAMYAKDYSRKQENFREMCKRTGRVMGIHAPYGYRFSKESNNLEIDEATAPYVRMIFAWALSGVKNLEISKRMELMGAPTPATCDGRKQGEHWTPSTVKQILYNPAYAGFHVMGKSKVSLYKGIKATKLDRKEWIYLPNYHEPYITAEDYEKIEKMITATKADAEQRLAERAEQRAAMPDVFPNMIYCAECGRQMSFCRGSHHRGYKEYSYNYYRCRNTRNTAKCNGKKVQQNYLKILVMEQIRLLIHAACDKNAVLQNLKQSLERTGSINHVQRNILRLTEREKELDEKLAQAYMDHADRLLDDQEYSIFKGKMQTDKAAVSEKKEKMCQKLTDMESALGRYVETTEKLEKYLQVVDFDENMVRELIGKILVYDDGSVSIEFLCEDVFQNEFVDEFLTENKEKGEIT